MDNLNIKTHSDCNWFKYAECIKILDETSLVDKKKNLWKENEFRIYLAFLLKEIVSEYQITLIDERKLLIEESN